MITIEEIIIIETDKEEEINVNITKVEIIYAKCDDNIESKYNSSKL